MVSRSAKTEQGLQCCGAMTITEAYSNFCHHVKIAGSFTPYCHPKAN